MRIGYYILRKGKLLFSQDSEEVLYFFKDLLENDMIEFPVEEKVKPTSFKEIPYLKNFKKDAEKQGLNVAEYVRYLLTNSEKQISKNRYPPFLKIKDTWNYRVAIWAVDNFYNPPLNDCKINWVFVKKKTILSSRDFKSNHIAKKIYISSFEELLNINLDQYEPERNQKIKKLSYIKDRLKTEKFSLEWFLPLLEENTIIKGFKITDEPYTNVHQNLFQDKVKFSSQEFPCFPNQFILERTNCKSDKLYLCKLRTLNPTKFRLVLKTHKENIIVGVLPLNLSIDGKKVNNKTEISIPTTEYEIGHLKINIKKDGVKQIKVFSDFHLNHLFNRNFISITKGYRIGIDQLNKRVEIIRYAKDENIRVTFESFIRVLLRKNFDVRCWNDSLISDNGLPSIIGQSKAKEFENLNFGEVKDVNHYFGKILDFSFLDKEFTKSNNKQNANLYLGTYVSKKGSLYVKVISANYDDFINYRSSDSNMFWQNRAERGWSSDEIEKEREEKEWLWDETEYYEDQNDDYDAYGDTDLGNPNGWW